MKHAIAGALGFGLVLTAAAPARASAHVVVGSAAVADFEQTSADGCTHTTGQLAVLAASPGSDNASGVYVTGVQEDLCGGSFGSGFAAYVPGGMVAPLLAAREHATIVAASYSGGAPVTLEVDLTWLGTGAVTRDGGVFDDGTSIELQWSRSRAARFVGTLAIDGEPAQVSNGLLAFSVQGTITR